MRKTFFQNGTRRAVLFESIDISSRVRFMLTTYAYYVMVNLSLNLPLAT